MSIYMKYFGNTRGAKVYQVQFKEENWDVLWKFHNASTTRSEFSPFVTTVFPLILCDFNP